jgi:hypothetical protein
VAIQMHIEKKNRRRITEKSCHIDLFLVTGVQKPPRQHQKSRIFNNDAELTRT